MLRAVLLLGAAMAVSGDVLPNIGYANPDPYGTPNPYIASRLGNFPRSRAERKPPVAVETTAAWSTEQPAAATAVPDAAETAAALKNVKHLLAEIQGALAKAVAMKKEAQEKDDSLNQKLAENFKEFYAGLRKVSGQNEDLRRELMNVGHTLEETIMERLDERMASFSGKCDELEEMIAKQEEKVEGMGGQVSGMSNALDGLVLRMDAIERISVMNQERFTELDEQSEFLTGQMGALSQSMSGVEQKTRALKRQADAVQKQMAKTTTTTKAATAAAPSAAVEKRLTETESEIVRLSRGLTRALDAQNALGSRVETIRTIVYKFFRPKTPSKDQKKPKSLARMHIEEPWEPLEHEKISKTALERFAEWSAGR